jgi:hypothetical protein
MKIRMGFISNSSTTSFTIYGWTETQLSEHIGKLLPAFVGVNVTIDEDTFSENIEKLWSGHEWDVTCSRDESGYNVFGVGDVGDENFMPKEPTDDQKKELEAIAVKLGLPAPTMHQGTYYA